MKNRIDLIENFKRVVLGIDSINELSLRNYLLEQESSLKLDIVKTMLDSNKFSLIANEVFIKEIYPLLKNNQFIDKELDISISLILKEFPESQGILKKIVLKLSEEGSYDSDLGVIIAETEELDRFKITLFLGTLFEITSVINENEYIKRSFNQMNKSERKIISKMMVGTLIHELTHLIDYFRYTREELIKDYFKCYPLQNLERRAVVQEFLYHFVSEDGVQVIKRTDSVDDFEIFLKKKMKCWDILYRIDIDPNKELINNLIKSVYNYFKSGKNEFGKLKTERTEEIYPFVCVTRWEDIKNFVLPNKI